ncbi:MAG: cobalamin-dependent protein, partial [Oscillospiraceae bacterium]|nr:cobalamin-dependent protein [Oscillospiraceae bacterium]
MPKTVLLTINAKYVHASLAAWCLAAGVERYARLRHNVAIVESVVRQPDGDIAGRILPHRPDVVGISAYIWNAGKLPGLLALLRETLPGAVFVLGGPEASHNPEYWLTQGADYVLCGEGEQRFPMLLDALAERDDDALAAVPGLCYIHDGKTRKNGRPEPLTAWVNPY